MGTTKACDVKRAFPNQMELTMKFKKIISAILALSMATGGLAFAQDNRDPRNRGRSDEQRQPSGRNDQRDMRNDNRNNPNNGMRNGMRQDERGAGPNHAFRRGDRLPRENRNNQYVVNDWRAHRLSQPPRGYHWVQTGGDYVLAAIATGVILQLMLNQ
jgi:Ni/Co efflux regulator RcnB